MQTFLSEIARSLYDRYGDGVSELTLLFPSRRARLFFSDALAAVAQRPLWQPRFATVDELMEQIAGRRRSDHVKLLTELYKVYARHHREEHFDTFYFWGDMLLADFDQIDNYLINADVLFANIGDLHRLESTFNYLTSEQVALIRRFWSHFQQAGPLSTEQQRFVRIWETLGTIYHEFRDALDAQGLAYEGMVHRRAAERLDADEAVEFDTERRYAVIGFNALSSCERELFRWLQRRGNTEFYWDWDRYYVENADHEAGLFLRANLRDFAPPEGVVSPDHFCRPKEMVVVNSPSDSLQSKYVHTFLQGLLDRGLTPGKETAIVLTDESLLEQVLYAIPEGIEAVNVTMGYPLRQTTAYSFVERLLELQRRKRPRSGVVQFYHSDVTGLLGHPYILEHCAAEATDVLDAIHRNGTVYVGADRFRIPGLVERIFSPVEGWKRLSGYLREVLSEIGTLPAPEEDRARRHEFFSTIIDRLVLLETSLADSSLELDEAVFSSLLRKILQQVRVPYQGEPLSGIQVMGILETRNLDFEHVLVLSLNDDTFPGNRAVTSSFVPHNLRLAYGLPTPQHHEGVHAYYFYRLLQRAGRVHLAYCSRSDERRSGEPSRYLYQLQYESPHDVIQQNIPLNVNLSQLAPPEVAKTEEVAAQLETYLEEGGAALSPTAFYRFVECPLKFYFYSVAKIKPADEIVEEIDSPMFGTLLHRAMELLYAELIGKTSPGESIRALIDSPRVEEAVDQALREEYFKESPATPDEYAGNVLLVKETVCRYINGGILPYDAEHDGFSLLKLEASVDAGFEFTRAGRAVRVNFAGKADRIDSLSGGLLRVVDYKTGTPPKPFAGVEALFCGESEARRPAAFQTLLYSLVIARQFGRDVQPALYYVRDMRRADYSPLLQEKKGRAIRAVECYAEYSADFEAQLQVALKNLFDLSRPFSACEDAATCGYCDYREICRR